MVYITKYDLAPYKISTDQGPRAVLDCKEAGIPIRALNRSRVESSTNPVNRHTFGQVKQL